MRARIRGTILHYELGGPKGAPLVTLVHGFPFSRALWKGQLPALKRRFRVLTYDLRGLGSSGLGEAPQLMESYAEDLLSLLDWVGERRTAVAGLSMGGYVALRALQKAPERFWALGLCDTRADADPDAAKLGRAAGVALLRKRGVGPFVDGMLPKLLAPQTLKRRPAVAKALRTMMLRSREDGAVNALVAMVSRMDSSSLLPQLRIPVLCLVGQHDAITPPALARGMARAAPKAKCVVLKGAGHVSNLERPAEFNRALMGFLEKARP